MQNFGLYGIRNAEQFNFRSTLLVVLIFGIVTIISYFNELAKAGLLSGTYLKYRESRSAESDQSHNNLILHKDGNLHQLDLNLEPLREVINYDRSNKTEREQKINIAVHLGKNESYDSDTNGSLKIYQFENVLPNFYLTLNKTIFENLAVFNGNLTSSDSIVKAIKALQLKVSENLKLHHNATKVLMYQHDLGGYTARDCFIAEALNRRLVTSSVPLNAAHRTQWETMSLKDKAKFEFLYGPLSFGVCEGLTHKCSYLNMIAHPVDRVMQLYYLCKTNISLSVCEINKITTVDQSIVEFIKRQGSVLFDKLLYHSRHCKLVGTDEVCVHDPRTFFLMSKSDKMAYLEDILDNLVGWFSVIGLVKHFRDSMSLYEFILGWNLTVCTHQITSSSSLFDTTVLIDGMPYQDMRTKLLQDKQVLKYIGFDLAIYTKLEGLFYQQMAILDLLRMLSIQPVTEKTKVIISNQDQYLYTKFKRKIKMRKK